MRIDRRALLIVPALLVIVNCSALGQGVGATPAASSNAKYASDRILVKFRPTASVSARAAAHSMIGTYVLRRFASISELELVGLPNGMSVRQAVRAYQQRPDVEYAEPDYIVHAFSVPDDPLFPQMWNLLNTGQNGGVAGADIGATSAWNLSTGSQNVIVAVIDTGVDYTHQDLAANIWSDPSAFSTTANGVNISCAAGTHGFNAITGVCDPLDDNGHGTHVSGTIGAVGNNSLGVVGVNWSVQLLACKFLDATGSGQTSDAITCLDFVAALKSQGFNIVATNNSWGGGPYSQALNDAIQAQQQAGILFIAAAGNDFSDNDINPTYPANTFLPNVISVAATSNTDALAVFSNVGKHTVHLGAPGQQILSTLPGNTYGFDSGTSMATPHVAGAAALLAAQNPSLDWRAIKNLILAGGDPRAALAQTISGDRLNVYGAMTCAGKTLTKRLQPVNDAIAAAPGVPVTLEELNIDCAQPNGNVQVTVSPGGQTITLLDDGNGPDQSAGDGIYTAQWTPLAIGSYTLTFPGGDAVPVAVLDSYVYAPAPFSYRTITGTNLNLGDDNVAQVTSPFAIPFGGGSFTQLQVGSNGTISFTDAYSPFINSGLPTLQAPPITLVAPFWMDLYPVKGSAQNVYWAVTGSAPNRELVVEWRNVRSFQCHNDPTATVTFEVVFSESTSDVLFEYSDTTFGGLCTSEDHGYYATAGVQVAPTVGSQWSAFRANIGDGTALLWTVSTTTPGPNPVPSITSVSPATATEGGPAFTLTVNGSNFVPGAEVQFGPYTRVATYVSSIQLTAQILASDIAAGTGPSAYITVTNPAPGGGSSGTLTFPFTTDLPTITTITPSSVTAGSFSFSLVINGTGFAQTASSVYWNGTLLQGDEVINPTQLIIGVPFTDVANPGTAQVTVVNGSPGGGTSTPATLTILPPGGFSALYLQPPLWNGTANPQSLLSAQPPIKFLGWKYASRGGPNYLKAFQRSRADAPLPSANPAPSNPLENSTAAQSPSTLPATLPGLGMRSLLPADLIPTAVAVGDFNGDGIPDWVVANGGSNNLWVYLGRGDGTFTLATVIPLIGQSPIAVAVADLRGIGKLDLIVAEADSLTVGVLLGNGDGTFGPEQDYFVPGSPISVAVADFDGDGHLDVAAGLVQALAIPASGPLVLLPGNGAGGFGPIRYEPSQFSDPGTPESIVAADFEKNGKPDIVLVDPIFGALAYGNDGTGRFKFAQPVYGNPFIPPLTAAQGDVNEDGCPDVVIVDSLDIARVFLGNCDGTFQNQFTEVGLGDIGWGLALADVNGDGHLDLIYSGVGGGGTGGLGQSAGNLIGVLLGDGSGNFGNARVYRGGQSSYGLAVGDFNKDGHPDIIAANQNSDSVTLLLNDGTGNFGAPQGGYMGYVHGNNSSGPVNSPITGLTPVDVDGDGQKDLVVMQLGPGTPNPYQITVMLNQGGGKFGPPILSPGMEGTVGISDYVLADFRNTGHPDFLALSDPAGLGYSFLVFAPNTGGGHFGTPQVTHVTGFGIMAVGDFNGDGNLDFAAAAAVSNSPTNAITITIYLGHGNGTFTQGPPITFNTNSPGHWPAGLWIGDFNHDGKLDLLVWMYENVVPYSTNDVYELLGNGDGTFAQPKQVLSNLSGFVVADVNHDGLPDIIESRDPQADYPAQLPPQYRIFLGQPDGSFNLTNTYGPYSGWAAAPSLSSYGTPNGSRYTPWVGDFNGDGNIDIAAFQQRQGFYPPSYYVQFLLGNGDGTFTPTYDVFDLHLSVPSAAADFNGDGMTDLAELDGFTSSLNVILGQAAAALQTQMVSDPVTGTNGAVRISLNVPAASGTTVNLTASDPAISIPASVVIPQGALTQDVNFTIGNSFNPSHVFSIQATLSGSTAVAYGTQAQPGGQYGVAMYLNSSSESTTPGGTTPDYELQVNSLAGYSTILNLSCQGLPSGAVCQFGTPQVSVPAGQNVATSLFVNTSSSLALGVYPFTIVGTDGNVTSNVAATLDVGDFTVSLSPGQANALPNSNASYSLNIGVVNNYSANLTATCQGLPAPAVCDLGSVVIAGSNPISILTNSLPVGSYPFTVSVTNGIAPKTAAGQLNIWDFKASLSSNSVTVAVGQPATVGLTVTGQNGFTDPVSLACIGAPTGVSCSISPGTLTPSSAGTPATLTITVTTKPGAAAAQSRHISTAAPARIALLGMALGMVLVVVPLGTRSRRTAVTSVVLLAIGLALACGGGGGSGGGGGGGGGGPVSFTLTVQATADNVTNSSTLKVTVP